MFNEAKISLCYSNKIYMKLKFVTVTLNPNFTVFKNGERRLYYSIDILIEG